MEVNVEKILVDNMSPLTCMLLDYFEEIDASKIVLTGKGREVNYPYLASYWNEEDRIPLYVLSGDEIIGFVLINSWTFSKRFNATRSIAEFYIKPDYRRKGVGRIVAFDIFRKYRGKWEIRQTSTNQNASAFWRSILGEYTNEKFIEELGKEGEVIQFFEC